MSLPSTILRRSISSKVYNTPSYFENILRKYEKNDSISVSDVKIEDACPKGCNFVTDVRRVKVEGVKDHEEYDKLFITKQKPETNRYINMEGVEMCFENEIMAYEKILPLLNKHSSSPLAIPDVITAEKDIIAIEDLTAKGFRMINQKTFTVPQVHRILEELAKFHASSMVMQAKEPQETIKDATNSIKEIVFTEQTNVNKRYETQVKIAQEILEGARAAGNISVHDVLKKFDTISTENVKNTVFKPRNLSVITHGDLWKNNILIKENEVKFIDFQGMRFTSVAADLNFFFYINVEFENFANNLKNFMYTYLHNLNKYVALQGVDLASELTVEWLHAEMKEFAPFGIRHALCFLPLMHFSLFELMGMMELSKLPYEHVVQILPHEYKQTLTDMVVKHFEFASRNFET